MTFCIYILRTGVLIVGIFVLVLEGELQAQLKFASSPIHRPNGGDLVASEVLYSNEKTGVYLDYKIYKVQWDEQDIRFVSPCVADDDHGNPALNGEMPELWRFETHLKNRSTLNTIHFTGFPGVSAHYTTGTSMLANCRVWGAGSYEAFLNHTYVDAGDVYDKFSPSRMAPQSSATSVTYGTTLKPFPYKLAEWHIGQYFIEQKEDSLEVTLKQDVAEKQFAGYLQERRRLDEVERKLEQLRRAEEQHRAAEEQRRIAARKAKRERALREKKKKENDNFGKTLIAVLGGAAIAYAGKDSEDIEGVMEDARRFMEGVLNEQPVGSGNSNSAATPSQTQGGQAPSTMQQALQNLENVCGEKYRGNFADYDHGRFYCLAAFNDYCALKRAQSSEVINKLRASLQQNCAALKKDGIDSKCPYCK